MNKTKGHLRWLLLLLGLSACTPTPKPYHHTLYVFGTLVHLSVYTDTPQAAQTAFQQINTSFQAFHHRWHAWEPGGIVGKINQAIAQEHPITVPEDLKAFILKSQQLTRTSLGYFDPGIGTLVDLWGFHSDTFTGPPPSETQIQQWLQQRPSILQLYFKGHRLFSTNPHVRLDFGGNAKGLALEMALNFMQQAGIHHGIVNIGGDMKTLGEKPQGHPWRIGVTDPFDKSRLMAEVLLKGGEALVTSGTYERFYTWKEQQFSHILNPNTGKPAEGIVSVTVLHHDAITADAAATALLAAGKQSWQAVAQHMALEYYAITFSDGHTVISPALQSRWRFTSAYEKAHPSPLKHQPTVVFR